MVLAIEATALGTAWGERRPIPDTAFRQLVEHTQDIVIVTDAYLDSPGPYIRYVNPAFCRLTGWLPDEVIGQSPRMLQGPGTDKATLVKIGTLLRAGQGAAAKVLNYGRNSVPYWLDMRIVPLFGAGGRIEGFAAFERDVTLDKRRLDEMEHLAHRDTLTGIMNRRALTQRAEAELASCPGSLYFAWIDIDHFKTVNDTHGHDVGDAVLMGMADLLGETVRRADLVGRMGGEEFAICMPGLARSDALGLVERIRRTVASTMFATSVGPLRITCSLGLSAAKPGDHLRDLMRRADLALYDAKQNGRDQTAIR